jgi:hypothetical protein
LVKRVHASGMTSNDIVRLTEEWHHTQSGDCCSQEG